MKENWNTEKLRKVGRTSETAHPTATSDSSAEVGQRLRKLTSLIASN